MIGQLRSGILPLEIETGRFRNIPLHERIYHVCNQNNVENEYHFYLHALFMKNYEETGF